MLIFPRHRLTYLATPKTGSTAVEMALCPYAEIVFAKRLKHMNARRYKAKVEPLLRRNLGIKTRTLAVMRDPEDQIRSWYRYRARPEMAGQPRYTGEITFDAFVLAVISEDPPDYADIGSQFGFLTGENGDILVDHLFAYNDQNAFLAFLSARLGTDIVLPKENVSPKIDARLSAPLAALLREARSEEFALYDQLMTANGYLTRR